MTWTTKLTACVGTLALSTLALGCGDDGSDGGSGGEAETTLSETAGDSDSAETGSGTASGTDTDTDTEGEEETGEETDTAEETDTEAESPCFDLETQDECDADPACQSVIGQPLKQNGPDAPCLDEQEFVGCIEAQGCDDAPTWFCVGGNGKPILVNDGCGPEDGEMCEPPVADPPMCP